MHGWLIKRVEDGKYVTLAGSPSSYTTRLERARVWKSREAAEAEACENERVVAVGECMHGLAGLQ